MLEKKGVIEFSWIFSLIIGAMILFLTFFFLGHKLIESKNVEKAQVEHSLDSLLNPFSYFGSLGATSSKEITLQKKEKINFSCYDDSNFGYISIGDRKVYDKYIFSNSSLEGKNFQVISKPLNLPWRVADLIYFVNKEKVYCFINIPEIEKEFGGEGMNISNFRFVSNFLECGEDSIKICTTPNCDIRVDKSQGAIIKEGKTLFFSGDALMYAAIFSDPQIYNCNLKRLAKRLSFQISVYEAKSIEISRRCSVIFNLAQLRVAAENLYNVDYNVPFQVKEALNNLIVVVNNINNQNTYTSCRLF